MPFGHGPLAWAMKPCYHALLLWCRNTHAIPIITDVKEERRETCFITVMNESVRSDLLRRLAKWVIQIRSTSYLNKDLNLLCLMLNINHQT